MAQIEKTYISHHSIDQLYQLVMDIEKYPEFIPWCSAASIVEEANNIVIADLFITFKAFTESYRSKVTSIKTDDTSATIDVSMISGPFQRLHNVWRFEKCDTGTTVHFFIDFKFRSFLLEKLIGMFFTTACEKMVDAFEKRALELYG